VYHAVARREHRVNADRAARARRYGDHMLNAMFLLGVMLWMISRAAPDKR